MPILAAMPVVDPIAVADIKALLAAIAPDRELHKPRKYVGKKAVELPSVDPVSDQANDVSAAAWSIAPGPVRVGVPAGKAVLLCCFPTFQRLPERW
jgi:hypothetical protein